MYDGVSYLLLLGGSVFTEDLNDDNRVNNLQKGQNIRINLISEVIGLINMHVTRYGQM